MRTLPFVLAALVIAGSGGATVAFAGETIIIHDTAPAHAPKPKQNYFKIAPRYSDYAILHDTWTKAWVLLYIDEKGQVTRLKLLHAPGAGLNQIAVDTGLGMKFSPAQDANGYAVASKVVWPIEWVSYWYMVDFEGVGTRVPVEKLKYVPCAGTGPWMMGSFHPAYRDCTPPDLSQEDNLPWLTKQSKVGG